MNLRPLVLGVSILACASPPAFSQQTPASEADNDLGFSPAQMADFAGQPVVAFAAGQEQAGAGQQVVAAGMIEQPQYGPSQYVQPQFGQPQFGPPQFAQAQFAQSQFGQGPMAMMAYQTPSPGPAAPPPVPQQAPQDLQLSSPPGWMSPNNVPYAMPASPGPAGVGPYGGPYPNALPPVGEPARPHWYFRGDNVWLGRDRSNNHNLTFYDNLNNPRDPRNNRFVLMTDDITYPLEPGMRLTLGRYITDTTMIEATYYGAVDWDRRNGTPNFPTGANGVGPLLPYWGVGLGAFDTGAFTGSNVQVASYESQFNSIELGVRHAIWGTTSILGAFRYVNIGDYFQLSASDNANNSNSGGNGFYRTWTNNNLAGFELGTEYSHDLWFPKLFGSFDARGGVYANFAEQKSLLFNSGDTYNQRSDREVPFATVWDVTFTLSYLATDHLTIRGGYTFLFVDGIALAPDQLDTNPTMTNSRRFIADNGNLTLQGPFVGGELAW